MVISALGNWRHQPFNLWSRGPESMEDFKKQMLTEHLADLRSCLIYSFIATGVGFALSYAFIKDVGNWFFRPLFKVLPDQTSLIFTSYQEAFFFI